MNHIVFKHCRIEKLKQEKVISLRYQKHDPGCETSKNKQIGVIDTTSLMNAKLYKPITRLIDEPPDRNVSVSFEPRPQQLNKTLERAEVVMSLVAAMWTETTAAVTTAMVADTDLRV